jgi:hypothetical protein
MPPDEEGKRRAHPPQVGTQKGDQPGQGRRASPLRVPPMVGCRAAGAGAGPSTAGVAGGNKAKALFPLQVRGPGSRRATNSLRAIKTGDIAGAQCP